LGRNLGVTIKSQSVLTMKLRDYKQIRHGYAMDVKQIHFKEI